MPILAAIADAAPAHMSAENFPVALRVLPRAVRGDLARVYTFARFVDDVGDDTSGMTSGPEQRLQLLDLIAERIERLPGTSVVPAELAPVAGLAPLVRERRVPVQPFLDLIEANRVDQRVASYATFDDLLDYCRLSAAPVGRIVLHVADAASARNVTDSDSVCAALQVLEHCQDVGEDARRGRIYLPATELADAGIDREQLTAAHTPPALRGVVATQVQRSRQMLRSGAPLVRHLSGWARFAVAGYVAGGVATADALDTARHDVLTRDIRPSRLRTAGIALRLIGRLR